MAYEAWFFTYHDSIFTINAWHVPLNQYYLLSLLSAKAKFEEVAL